VSLYASVCDFVRMCVRESVFTLLYLVNTWHILTKLITVYSLPGPRDADDIFKIMRLKVKKSCELDSS